MSANLAGELVQTSALTGTRRWMLSAAAAGVVMLSVHRAVRGMQGSGSISIQGFLCPSDVSDVSDCQVTDEIFGGAIVLVGPNGIVLTLNDGESHAVSHFWDGLPYGTYALQSLGATPSGYALSRIDGATDDGGYGQQVTLDDDTPSVSINLIFIPW